MKINKTWAALGSALAIGLVAAIGANRYISNQLAAAESRDKNKQTVKVVVARSDLVRGTKLTAENVAVRAIPVEYAHSGAVSPEQFDRVENETLAYNIKGGEAILWAELEGKRAATFSTRVATGRRAMSIAVDEISSISGMLEPGDSVDLMLTIDQHGRKVTFPVIQSVQVLAAGQRVTTETTGEKRSYSTITLDTTPEEARRLIIARDAGKLTALLRNPLDKNAISNTKGDLGALFGLQDGSGVPVLYGGRGKLDDIPKLGPASNSPQLSDTLATSAKNPPEVSSGGNTPVLTATSIKNQ
jgi:pilus assembly protein CpaB